MIFERIRRFFIGRCGPDPLNLAMLVVGALFSLFARLFSRWLYLPADLLYLAVLLRALSKNLPARQKENDFFVRKIWLPVSGAVSGAKQNLENHQRYKYFRCPKCGQKLRAPRGRGKIQVTCQRCRTVFERKV